MSLAAWLFALAPLVGAVQDDPREYEREVLKPVFDKYYEAGSAYYKNGWRNEALWCFERSTKILPEFSGLTRFVGLLRDFDNPAWRTKRWKSPRAAVDSGFGKKQQSFDLSYATALLKIGGHHASQGGKRNDGALVERARKNFVEALEVVGGPYDVDASGRIVVGKAGTIPEEFSKRMLVEDLVLINGKRWLRDSMLRSLKDVASVHEARTERCLVRTVTSEAEAKRLLDLLEQAYPAFLKSIGERKTSRPLGLFLFADRPTYEEWCKSSKNEARVKAAGFANCTEGFAVSFAQGGIEAVALHEGAHLYHFDVYASAMPSWYEEGLAESFGQQHAIRIVDGKLTTELRPTKALLASLVKDGKLTLPFDVLLHGDATAKIAADDDAAAFYLASWALYSFLATTKEPRLADKFNDWESFALGSRWAKSSRSVSGAGETPEDDATRLFDRIFNDVKPLLEAAFADWIANPN